MTTVVQPVYRDHARPRIFFAPKFKVWIESPAPTPPLPPCPRPEEQPRLPPLPRLPRDRQFVELDPLVAGDILQVTYKDDINKLDSVDLDVNNWDADRGRFKYIGYEGECDGDANQGPSSLAGPSNAWFSSMFAPGRGIKVAIGYGQELREVMVGTITSVDPDFPASGASKLRVSCLNELHTLRHRQHTHIWENKKDSEIAEAIARQPTHHERPGFGGLEIEVPGKGSEQRERYVFQNNQFDIVLLLQRARRRGYSLKMKNYQEGERTVRKLFFGPDDHDDVTFELKWGESLVSFNPTFKTADQVTTVRVRGWDRRSRGYIKGEACWGKPGLDINTDCQLLVGGIAGREEEITDRPVRDEAEAQALAESLLRGKLQEMVTAQGVTVGLPELTAGREVHIQNLGPCVSGKYFVTSTTHTVGDSGYQTTFEARREGPLP